MKETFNYLRYIVPVVVIIWGIFSNRPDIEVDENEDVKVADEKVLKGPLKQITKENKSEILSPLSKTEKKLNSRPDRPSVDYRVQENISDSFVQSGVTIDEQIYNKASVKESYYQQYLEEPNSEPPLKSSVPLKDNPTYAIPSSTQIIKPKPTATPKATPVSNEGGSDSIHIAGESNAQSGTYTFPLEVELKLKINGQESSAGTIYYCKSEDHLCCNVFVSSSTYTAALDLGDQGNGPYCLVFYGKTSNGIATNAGQILVTIDNTLPAPPMATVTEFYMQTTERYSFYVPRLDYPESSEKIILTMHHTLDPLYTNDCQDVVEDLPPLDYGMTAFDFKKYLEFPFDFFFFRNFAPLDYGDNYYFFLLAKQNIDAAIYNCSHVKIVVKDFELFSSEPIKSSSLEFVGGFSAQGFFKAAPFNSGSGRNDELHSNFLNSLY